MLFNTFGTFEVWKKKIYKYQIKTINDFQMKDTIKHHVSK